MRMFSDIPGNLARTGIVSYSRYQRVVYGGEGTGYSSFFFFFPLRQIFRLSSLAGGMIRRSSTSGEK